MIIRNSRRGYTLFELIVIIAILIILAVILIPSLTSFRGDSRLRAGADVIRAELAIARARAKEEGQPYRIAVSSDGTRIRRAPDTPDFPQVSAFDQADGSMSAVDYLFDQVKVTVSPEAGADPPPVIGDWQTIATVQPDGTCVEITTLLAIQDNDGPTIYLRIRGMTGNARIVPNPNTTPNGGTK